MKKNIIISIFIVLIIIFIGINFIKEIENKNINKQDKIDVDLKKIKSKYSTYVKTNKKSNIYNEHRKKVGLVEKSAYIILEDDYKIVDEYYKIKNSNYYIKFKDVEPSSIENYKYSEFENYKNYIPFNENIVTNNNYKLYLSNGLYFELNESEIYPIIIKDDLKYGVEFNNQLAYVNKEDVSEVVAIDNSNDIILSSIAVLNYHFTIDANTDERKECVQDICIPETQVDEQIKYLKDNNYYSTTMRDVYLFLNNKIRLPEKSVTITIDDGWYVPRMISILEKYQMTGTLFLIGSLADRSSYISNYLEVHSHTWNMHNPGICSGTHGGGILCLDEEKVLEDLKKSRQSLDNTVYFCYPFYEYNERAENLVKKANFEMAFIGGNRKAKPGDNIYRVPRYVMYDGLELSKFIKMVS